MKNWPMIKVADEFDLQMGKTPARDNPAYWGGDQKWASIADIGRSDMYLADTKEAITQEAVSESGIKAVPPNTVVMSFKLSIGRTAITASRMYTNEAIMAFLPHDASAFDLHFLYHLFSNRNWSEGCNKAVKGVTLNKATLNAARIPKPDISEQRAVASTLDKICDLMAICDEQIVRLDQLVKSRFVEMFGDPVSNPKKWNVRRISEFADVRIGPFGSLLHKEDYIQGGHPLVNPSHMVDGKIVPDNDLTLSDSKYKELVAYQLRLNDVVIARRGEIGRCALVKKEGFFCGTGSMFVRIKKDCRADYLQRVISYPTFAARLEDAAVGITMKNINAGMIEDCTIPLPPPALQREFAAFVAKVDKLAFAARQRRDVAKQLYRAKIQEFFG